MMARSANLFEHTERRQMIYSESSPLCVGQKAIYASISSERCSVQKRNAEQSNIAADRSEVDQNVIPRVTAWLNQDAKEVDKVDCKEIDIDNFQRSKNYLREQLSGTVSDRQIETETNSNSISRNIQNALELMAAHSESNCHEFNWDIALANNATSSNKNYSEEGNKHDKAGAKQKREVRVLDETLDFSTLFVAPTNQNCTTRIKYPKPRENTTEASKNVNKASKCESCLLRHCKKSIKSLRDEIRLNESKLLYLDKCLNSCQHKGLKKRKLKRLKDKSRRGSSLWRFFSPQSPHHRC